MSDIVKYDMTDIWASTGDVVAPDPSKIAQGWGVELVPRQWWNWFENRQDNNIAYMLQKGIPEWDATTEYQINKSYVQRSGVVYKATTTHTNSDPLLLTNWLRAFDDYSVAGAALGALTPAANTLPYFTSGSAAALTNFTAFARTLLDDGDAATMRATLSAQALNTALTAISGVTPATNVLPYFTGTTTAAGTTFTSLGRLFLAAATASGARAVIDVYGTAEVDSAISALDAAKQPLDATLTALAGVATATNALPYFTGVDAAAVTTLTSYARTLLDDTDAATARGTLGLGSIATQSSSSVSITGGSITGIADLAVADGGTGASNAADARTNLGVYSTAQTDSAISASAATRQPLDATLTAVAGLTTAADSLPYFTGVDTAAVTTLSAYARTFLDDADAAAARTTLGLANSATITATAAATAGTIILRDDSGGFSAGTINANLVGNASSADIAASCLGNASTANTLATSRTIALSGEVTGTATSFNGGANISIATSITDSGLLTPTLVNGFSHGGTPLRYRKVGNIVHVEGQVNRATAPLAVTCTTLPAGYRPSRTVFAIVELYGATNAQRVIYSLALGSTGELNFIWLSAEATNATQPTGTLTFSINLMFVV